MEWARQTVAVATVEWNERVGELATAVKNAPSTGQHRRQASGQPSETPTTTQSLSEQKVLILTTQH